MWDTTQAPIPIRNGLARMFGLSVNQVRVIAPFVGGGFGPKIMMFYPEEMLLPWISMQLERPIKWVEDRIENLTATAFARDYHMLGEIAAGEVFQFVVRDSVMPDVTSPSWRLDGRGTRADRIRL